MLPHLSIKFDFDWQSSFREEDFLNIMVYTFCPGWVQTNPWDPIFSESSIHLPISCKCFPSNDNFSIFPIKCMGDLCWPCHKTGQGHHRVMTYERKHFTPRYCMPSFVEIDPPVLEKNLKGFFLSYMGMVAILGM